MTFNKQFVEIYKRNASLVGIRSTKPSGNYTYYIDISTYLGESYVSIMRNIALLFNYQLYEFNDYDPNDAYWMQDDVSKPGCLSCVFSHVEAIDVKIRKELHNRSLDQINAKHWYDSYLKACKKIRSQQVHFEKTHSYDNDFDRLSHLSFGSYGDSASDYDPEEHFDVEEYGIERM